MVMVHGDDKGLVLPPRVASVQVIVIPVPYKDADTQGIFDACNATVEALNKAGIRAEADLRDNYSPGWKYSNWEMKGVPLRIEIGPKDLANNQVSTSFFVSVLLVSPNISCLKVNVQLYRLSSCIIMMVELTLDSDLNSLCSQVRAVRRDNGAKIDLPRASLVEQVNELLDKIQQSLFDAAKQRRDDCIQTVTTWDEFIEALSQKKMILAPWCDEVVSKSICVLK